MIEIRHETSLDALSLLKSKYLAHATAPLDGMWLTGFVPVSQHYSFYVGSERIGFFCVNDDGYILQFYIEQPYQNEGPQLFNYLASNQAEVVKKIHGAFTSTAEPHMLTHCFDTFTNVEVVALMYQSSEAKVDTKNVTDPILLQEFDMDHLDAAVSFVMNAIGAPVEWLRKYLENLINRRELFGYWENEALAATGERRLFDEHQIDFADLGVIVSPDYRGKGLATKVIAQLKLDAWAMGKQPICSTERTNIAAQKAITRAGFVAHNRIVKFE